jgi:hypothetical protein
LQLLQLEDRMAPAILPPTISVQFLDPSLAHQPLNAVSLNGTARLEFAIENPNSTEGLTGISFTDNLPAGLVVASPPNEHGPFSTLGTVTAVAGSSTISLSGDLIEAGWTDFVDVDVTGTTAGVKTNTVQATCTEAGPGNTATASLTVVAPPILHKSFGDASIPVGGTTTLSFTVTNPNVGGTFGSGYGLSGVGFSDTLPAGLVIANPNNLTVGGYPNSPGTVTAIPGTNVITVSGGHVNPDLPTPKITVSVTGTTPGVKNNTTSAVTSNEAGAGDPASASLTVVVAQPPTISKAFDRAAIPLNGTAQLTFTITNPVANDGLPLTGVAFTDSLPPGLVVASPPHLTSTAGGTVSATAGSHQIILSGGTLDPNSTDTITLDVTGTTAGLKTNSATVTAVESGPGNTATASLNVLDPAHVWYVTNSYDYTSAYPAIPGSLRADVAAASDGDLILFPAGFQFTPIKLYRQIDLDKSLTFDTVDGNDWGTTLVPHTLSGPEVRIFDVHGGATVTIAHVHLAFGRVGITLIPSLGGAILNDGGNLTLDHVTVKGWASDAGGAIYNNQGTLTLTNSTVDGEASSGGGIYNDGPATLINSTVSGGAADGGGIYNYHGPLVITNSTVTGTAGFNGGGILNGFGPLTLTNSTVATSTAGHHDILGDTPGRGGGIFNSSGTMTLTNCTVAYNSTYGGEGDGIYNDSYSSMLLDNTIVGGVANHGTLTGTNNLIENLSGPSDLLGTIFVDPHVDPPLFDVPWYDPGDLDHNDPHFLRDNGGPTQTLALLPGSKAFGAGDWAVAVDPSTSPHTLLSYDQRGPGYSRYRRDGSLDIGAFEVQDAPEYAYLVEPLVPGLEQLAYGQAGAFKASIRSDGRPVTAGTVTFLEGGTVLASAVPLDSSGLAAFLTTTLSAGVHNILVQYSGSAGIPAISYRALMTVAPAPLTITATDASKTYGQAVTFAGTEFTPTGLMNGDTVTGVTLTSAGAAATAAVAGSPYAIVPSAPIGSGLGNYTITYQSGALSVNPAPLTITAKDASKTYGQAVTFAGTEFTASGLVTANGDTVTSVTLTSDGAAAAAAVLGSPYAIVPSAAAGSGLSNYAITYANGALTVKPAPLVVTADPKWKITGEANPAFTASYQGFVLGQDPSVLGGLLTFSTPATASSPPDTYAITPGGLISGNYAITFVSGTLTVYSYGQATNLLLTQVNAAGLAGGLQNSLDCQLLAAMTSFDAGNTTAGVNQLGAFVNHVRAQRGKGIDAAVADALIAFAQRIIRAVG